MQKWKLRKLPDKYVGCMALTPEMLMWSALETDRKYIYVRVLQIYKVKDNRQKSPLCNSFDPLGAFKSCITDFRVAVVKLLTDPS